IRKRQPAGADGRALIGCHDAEGGSKDAGNKKINGKHEGCGTHKTSPWSDGADPSVQGQNETLTGREFVGRLSDKSLRDQSATPPLAGRESEIGLSPSLSP